MKEIQLGSIGSGSIVHSFLDQVMVTEGIRHYAVYSRNEDKGKALADAYGADKVYSDMADFLDDETMDVVYIASPNILHYPQVKMALEAGKHVICEKPFCTKASQAKELAALAKDKGLFLVDATPTAYLPNLEIMKKEMFKVGRVKLVQANYSQYSSRYDQLLEGQLTNVFDPAFGGGCLMDINYYNVFLTMALFGKPVSATYYPNIYPGAADTSGILMMQYEDFVCELSGAKDTWGINFFQIEGETGYIYADKGSNGLGGIHVVTKHDDQLLDDQGNQDRMFFEVQAITRMIREDNKKVNDERLELMIQVMEVIEDVRKKAGIIYPGDDNAK